MLISSPSEVSLRPAAEINTNEDHWLLNWLSIPPLTPVLKPGYVEYGLLAGRYDLDLDFPVESNSPDWSVSQIVTPLGAPYTVDQQTDPQIQQQRLTMESNWFDLQTQMNWMNEQPSWTTAQVGLQVYVMSAAV